MGIKMRTKNIRTTIAYYNHWGPPVAVCEKCGELSSDLHYFALDGSTLYCDTDAFYVFFRYAS